MNMNKRLLSMAIGAALTAASQTTLAALPVKAKLNFDAGAKVCAIGPDTTTATGCLYDVTTTTGSYFSMDQNGGGVADSEKTIISQNNGIILGQVQAASGSHSGAPDGSETPDIDNPWGFFTNTGMHQTTSAVTMLSDDAAGNVTLDMAGWSVTWNNIADIPMGGEAAQGDTSIATMTCAVDCAAGDTYTLDYAAHVPLGDPSSFGGVPYTLHLEGTIVDLNQAPTAVSLTVSSSVAPSGSTLINVIGNVTDPDGNGEIDGASTLWAYAGTATIEQCTGAATPNALCDVAGNLVYIDNGGVATTDSFTYTISDIYGASTSSVTVNMDVVVGNLPPSCGGAVLATNLGTPINVDVVGAGYATDSDGSVDATTIAVSNPVNGTLGTPDPTTGVVTVTPTAAGAASFQYTVDDDAAATCSPAGMITINVNDLPVAVNDTGITVDRNSSVLIDVPANDTDSDGTLDKTTVAIVSAAAHGTTSVDPVSGKVTYTPTPANVYTGADSFTYTIADNLGATSNAATVSITINNAAPVAVNDSADIDIALLASVDINVVANDSDSDGSIDNTSVVASQGSNGSTSAGLTGVVTYTPNGGYVGTDTFTYTVFDAEGAESNTATVTVNIANSSTAVLDPAAFLSIEAATIVDIAIKPAVGSWFSMETSPGNYTYTAIQGFNQLQLGTIQPAFSGSLDPAVAASPNIDNIWQFFGNAGVHQTTSTVTILSDDGNGNVTLDLSGWSVSWNGIETIPMNSNATVAGFADGVAIVTCAVDCSDGDTYVLEYSATVPLDDASGFGGVHYFLRLDGSISLGVTTIGGGNINAAHVVDETSAVAVNDGGQTVTVMPGTTAVSVGNTTGVYLTVTDIGLKDPKLNVNDGAQCVGGCIDFYATGVTPGGYVDIVVYLSEAIPEGASYRKLMNGVWKNFDTSQGDLVGSATAIAGACQGPDGAFEIGLRAGNQCLFLRVTDGGANDADGVADGVVTDPSGVLVAGSANVPASSTNGCSVSNVPVKLTERVDWLLVAAFIAGFGLLTFRRRERNILC